MFFEPVASAPWDIGMDFYKDMWNYGRGSGKRPIDVGTIPQYPKVGRVFDYEDVKSVPPPDPYEPGYYPYTGDDTKTDQDLKDVVKTVVEQQKKRKFKHRPGGNRSKWYKGRRKKKMSHWWRIVRANRKKKRTYVI